MKRKQEFEIRIVRGEDLDSPRLCDGDMPCKMLPFCILYRQLRGIETKLDVFNFRSTILVEACYLYEPENPN